MGKMEFELDFSKYDLVKVINIKDFTKEYLYILEILITGIEKGYFNETKTQKGTFYVVSIPKISVDFEVFESAPDNILRKFKLIDTKYGFIEFIKGKWVDPKFGYTQTAFKLNKKKIADELYN